MIALAVFYCNADVPPASAFVWKDDLLRATKNLLSAPVEIPMTVQEYHEQAGWPVVRHLAGVIEGAFQAVLRFESGLWDFLETIIPGDQDPLVLQPETFF